MVILVKNLLIELFLACVLKLLHESIYDRVIDQLLSVYKQVKVGDPLEKGTLLGPLHTSESRKNFEKGIETIKSKVCCSFPLWPYLSSIYIISNIRILLL